ncbi:MAG TPA: ZIP family metal transporter [Cycloclasticus sp.]|jgi:zinc and cadmium transporter|nr:ZIP family metal transporter [Cycloclasticus sp.]HIL92340.1 ZIP family metal transporter [Cycloclasticus sp.]
MTVLTWIILFTLFGGVLSVLGASLVLFLPKRIISKALPFSVSFATGALLSVSFVGLLPHALEEVGSENFHTLSMTILGGLMFFFILEKLVLWRHCHHDDCEGHVDVHANSNKSAGTLILVGDSVHNFVDGILIAAAFLTDIHLGVVTALAVTTHEIPQEIGDFAILLQSGFTRKKAILYNVISSFATLVGGLLAYFWLADFQHILPYILAFAAASFIYIAVADLIPTLHKRVDLSAAVEQIMLMLFGIGLIGWLHSFIH